MAPAVGVLAVREPRDRLCADWGEDVAVGRDGTRGETSTRRFAAPRVHRQQSEIGLRVVGFEVGDHSLQQR